MFHTFILLWLVVTFLFFFFRFMPGSYLDVMAFEAGTSQESLSTIEDRWGLNDPLHVQYWKYIVNLASLNAGTSLQYNQPVWNVVKMRIFNSAILVAPAITCAYIVGTILGTIAGNNRGTNLEKYTIIAVMAFGTMPSFVLGIILVIIFAGWLGWFPAQGMMTPETLSMFDDAEWWRQYVTYDFAHHFVLPFGAIVLRHAFSPMLVMRTSVVEVLDQDFIKYYQISGLPKNKLYQHIGRHSILPVVTIYPISLARALGGLVLIEVVFNWPGIGFTLVQGVLFRDIPLVMFVFFITAAFIIIANFIIDIVYSIIDPRVSVGDR